MKPDLNAVPENDAAIEGAILGAMMSEPSAVSVVLAMDIQPQHFYFETHDKLFATLLSLAKEYRNQLDLIVIRGTLKARGLLEKVGGADYLLRLVEDCPNAANIETYCKRLLEIYRARKAKEAATKLLASEGHPDDAAREAAAELSKLSEATAPQIDPIEALKAQIQDEISSIRSALEFPWYSAMTATKCFLPGTITMLCGSAGASKSLLTLEMVWRLFFAGVPCSKLDLESGVPFHLRRAIAQMSDNSKLTDAKFALDHPDEMRSLWEQMLPKSNELTDKHNAVLQAPEQGKAVDCEYLCRWISQEADKGRRLVMIDPITMMESKNERETYHKQASFVKQARAIVDRRQISLLLVIHPRKMGTGDSFTASLDNLAGVTEFQRFTDTVFWLEAHKPQFANFSSSAMSPGMMEQLAYNRTLHVLKARLGPHAGRKIAYFMDSATLRHTERGFVE